MLVTGVITGRAAACGSAGGVGSGWQLVGGEWWLWVDDWLVWWVVVAAAVAVSGQKREWEETTEQ